MRFAVPALTLAMGCGTVHQAVRTQHVSEVVAGASIATMIVASVVDAYVPAASGEAKVIAVASIPVTLAAVGTYIAMDRYIPDVPPGPVYQQSEQDNRLARSLAHDAALAARADDCGQVRTLESRVRELDLNVHLAMLHNRRIVACLREPLD